MSGILKIWPPKTPAEEIWLTFNFTAEMLPGNQITNSTVIVSLRTGVDAAPAQTIDGAISIEPSGRVYQKVKGGNHKAQYLYKCVAQISDGRVLERAGALPVFEYY
jgi:hypothetical protein